MYYHYWEGNSNELTSSGLDPISKTPTYKAAVRMKKISQEEYLDIIAQKREKFFSQKIIYTDYH